MPRVRLEYTDGLGIFSETSCIPPHERTPMAERPHNFLREGIITGFIGATAIAVWFLIVDTIAGHPFYTPIFLGKGVVSILGKNMMGDTAFTQVLGYHLSLRGVLHRRHPAHGDRASGGAHAGNSRRPARGFRDD